jgi:beta-lactamase superfamily II metal-dependent hydrolase
MNSMIMVMICIRLLKKPGFNKIDVVLISHLHGVYIGEMIYVLANMKVEKFYGPGFPYSSSTLF